MKMSLVRVRFSFLTQPPPYIIAVLLPGTTSMEKPAVGGNTLPLLLGTVHLPNNKMT